MSDTLQIGVDAGGSHCRTWLFGGDDSVLSKATTGPANVASDFECAIENLISSIRNALQQAGLNADAHMGQLDVGAGLAGLHSPIARQRLAEWKHPFKSFAYDSDLFAAHLGAHSGKEGATIVCGTGFSAVCVLNNERSELGGHGFPAGDKAGGAWIGLEALQTVFLAADGLAEKGALWQRIAQKTEFDVHRLAGNLTNMPAVEYAQYALEVFQAAEEGDARAVQIIKQAASYLDDVVQLLLGRGAQRICVVGSVGRALIDWLPHRTQVKVSPPEQGAERGALNLIASKVGAP